MSTQDFEVPAVFETSTNLVMLMHFMDMQKITSHYTLWDGEEKTVIQFPIDSQVAYALP